jgi:hypothetical protein
MKRGYFLGIAFLVFFLPQPIAGIPEQVSEEEVVARHLASIGSDEALHNLRSRILEGRGTLDILLGGSGTAQGKVVYTSEGTKFSFLFEISSPPYRGAKIYYDGNKCLILPTYADQQYSLLARLLSTHRGIIEEGLLGGTVSTAWALLRRDTNRARLKYRGLVEKDTRHLHRLEYRMRKHPGDLQVGLYFEPDTFRHVLTTYRLRVPARLGPTMETSVQQQDTHYLLEESFDQFQQSQGLSFPAIWKIRFTQPSAVWEWRIIFQKGEHNQPIDPHSFQLKPSS